jgi:hypothetical protein
MAKKRMLAGPVPAPIDDDAYAAILTGVTGLLESARQATARAVHSPFAAPGHAPLAREGLRS